MNTYVIDRLSAIREGLQKEALAPPVPQNINNSAPPPATRQPQTKPVRASVNKVPWDPAAKPAPTSVDPAGRSFGNVAYPWDPANFDLSNMTPSEIAVLKQNPKDLSAAKASWHNMQHDPKSIPVTTPEGTDYRWNVEKNLRVAGGDNTPYDPGAEAANTKATAEYNQAIQTAGINAGNVNDFSPYRAPVINNQAGEQERQTARTVRPGKRALSGGVSSL